jgi:hemolysin III
MVPIAVIAGVNLWLAAADGAVERLSVAVFAAAMSGLYATSGIYHVPDWRPRVRAVLGRCDVVMIQIFIAGTFTPVAVHALDGAWRTWSLAVAWAVVLVGASLTLSPIRAPRWLTAAAFVGFGWLAVLPLTQLIGALPWEGLTLIALGGLSYTVGAWIYARKRPNPWPRVFGFHEVFHLFVIAGATAHYLAIWRYVLPLAG